MATEEVKGIVLFKKDYRERDYLVKILTAEYGPIMFFVRGNKRQSGPIYRAIQPFTEADYIADIRLNGLSFIQGAKEVKSLSSLRMDIEKNAYASHVLALTNAASHEFEPNILLFHELHWTLNAIDQNFDVEALTLIFEVKALRHFGVMPNFEECTICHKNSGVFDYSLRLHGLLCPEHFYLDPKRLHASPRAMHLIRQFVILDYKKMKKLDLKRETKQEISYVLDLIYDDLVGLRLKTKKYIDQMDRWEYELEQKIEKIKKQRKD